MAALISTMNCCQAKYVALALLVVQTTCLTLAMRYSRTRPGTMYLGSTAVCCDEAMKLVICLGILIFSYLFKRRKTLNTAEEYEKLRTVEYANGDDGKNRNGHESLRSYLREQLQFDFRVAGLAGLYTVQKNLIYLAISNLDAAVFQVTYQGKVLTTAVFSVYFLRRKLSRGQILALFALTAGIALVEYDNVNAHKGSQEQRKWIGLLAVMGACCTSGFGGVYFELVLKPIPGPPGDGTKPVVPPPSVWAKNVQLSAFAFVIALVTALTKDHTDIFYGEGFFQGYSPLVMLVIALQAGGGLVVAAVIKYADNILKSFATAMSIVTSTLASVWIFGFSVSWLFAAGCLLQFIAIWLYSRD